MKVLQAKRERSDKISKLMGNYLLKGYKMLGSTCTGCETILLQDKQGVNYCVACSELDSDTVKDDPALSREAARRQAAEQQQRDGAQSPVHAVLDFQQSAAPVEGQSQQQGERVLAHQFPLIHRPCPTALESSSRFSDASESDEHQLPRVSDGQLRNIVNKATKGISQKQMGSTNLKSIEVVEEKLQWATMELKQCSSVEYSIQLCQLIASCADAIGSLSKMSSFNGAEH